MRYFIEKVARQAGAVLLKKFSQTRDVKAKGVKDLVTDADFAAEKVLLKNLEAGRFAAPVLSEESGGAWESEETFWIIDPLDGTLNYTMGNPLFGLNIAFVEEGVPKAGASFLPCLNEFFYVEKGKGVWLNDQRILCPRRSLEESVVFCGWSKRTVQSNAQGFAYLRKLSSNALAIRDPGTTAMGLAYVACGRYGGYVYNNCTPWDITAGCLMIQEAEGKVTDFEGIPWHHFMKSIVAGNAQNHSELLACVRKI